MLHRLLWAALFAGIVAGLATAVLQHFTTTPLILEAERYESGTAPDTAALQAPALLVLVHAHSDHPEDAEGWAPADGLERTLYTALATIGTAFGFALILLSAMVLARAPITARSGLLWGLAGFAAAGLAPALGLAPELPGSAAAALEARQAWWAATALATAAGLWLVLRVASPLAIVGGLILIALPQIVGAPHPGGFTSTVPAELAGHFAAASLVVMAVLWALTGTLAGWMWQRGEARQRVAAAVA